LGLVSPVVAVPLADSLRGIDSFRFLVVSDSKVSCDSLNCGRERVRVRVKEGEREVERERRREKDGERKMERERWRDRVVSMADL
jgi:hypothetical protein